jgi:hypothetical protein
MAGVRRCLENLSEAPLALCDLEEDGGGPGGGPGRGMPGSQVACRVGDLLPDRLDVLDETPPGPIALVDTALLEDGGIRATSAVFKCPPKYGPPPRSRWLNAVTLTRVGEVTWFP